MFAEKLGKLHGGHLNDKINHLYKQLHIKKATQTLHLRPDLTFIKASYLISNIDQAFDAWRSYPWSRHVSFKEFCNYILPYNVYTEPLEYWRKRIRKRFSWLADSLKNPRSLRAATRLLNKAIQSDMTFSTAMFKVPTAFGFSELREAGVGKCDHLVAYNAYVLRAMGIPARVDFVPVWANKDMGHSWLSIRYGGDSLYAFDAMFSSPDSHYEHYDRIPSLRKLTGYIASKVFRRTYKLQPVKLTDMTGQGNIPSMFSSRHLLDVTGQYRMPQREVSVRAYPSYHGKVAYLATFDGSRWRITARGLRSKNGRYKFRNVGAGVVYLPVRYHHHTIEPISSPILITRQKQIQLLDPDTVWTRPVRITRKYPVAHYVKIALRKMIGGVFEGANRRDFSDAEILYVIRRMPQPKTNRYHFHGGVYRYLRFILPGQQCRVAGMQFVGTRKGAGKPLPLSGKLISSSYVAGSPPSNIRDDNVLSYFVAQVGSGGWVGVDLGRPRKVTGVRFYPPNDGNSVEPGDTYKLFYWDDGWKSRWKKRKAKGEVLTFKHAPANALFILRDLTKGKDERIFTYNHGLQHWY